MIHITPLLRKNAVGLLVILFASLCTLTAQELPKLELDIGDKSPFAVRALDPSPKVDAGSEVRVRFQFTVPNGHYLFRDSIKIDVGQSRPDGFSIETEALPEGIRKKDEFLGEVVSKYPADTVVTCVVEVAANVRPGEYTLPVGITLQGCRVEPALCYVPETVTLDLAIQVSERKAELVGTSENPWAGQNRILILLLSVLGGLGLWLTPCVYPITPVTIALIGAGEAKSRFDGFIRSVIFVFGISLVYSLLGVIAAASGGLFGTWASSPVFYLVIAAVVLALAFSMFGFYSLQIPTTFASSLQARMRGRGGLIGLFFMGMISATILSPCITPFLSAALTYVLVTKDAVFGFLVFFCIAWGLGIPIIVLGTFTGLVKALPRSGDWLETVKHVLGVVMLGAAVYLVYLARIVPVQYLISAAAVALVTLSVFAGGFEPLPAEPTLNKRVRKVFGLLCFILAFSLFFRVLGIPAPGGPASSAIVGPPAAAGLSEQKGGQRKPGTPQIVPVGINWQPYSPAAAGQAREEGRPLVIDFTALWCAPCIELEKKTFTDPQVIAESKRFTCLKVDATKSTKESREVAAGYGVLGFPNIVFVDSRGDIVENKRIVGFVNAEEMLARMKSVR